MSQIFKNIIPMHILYDFLNDICDKTDEYYIFDINAYKRGALDNKITDFCNSIIINYHIAKQYYVTRNMSYTRFCTVLRQICKSNSINFTTKILYVKSKYHIPYYIYF